MNITSPGLWMCLVLAQEVLVPFQGDPQHLQLFPEQVFNSKGPSGCRRGRCGVPYSLIEPLLRAYVGLGWSIYTPKGLHYTAPHGSSLRVLYRIYRDPTQKTLPMVEVFIILPGSPV